MYELYYWNFGAKEWWLVGQYTTKKQAVIIAKDYQSRGFRAEVRHEDRVVWAGGYSPRIAQQ